MSIKWEDRYEQLGHLPEFALYSLATNEAASLKYRRTALEIMVQKGYKSAENPIFRGLGLEFEHIEVPEPFVEAGLTAEYPEITDRVSNVEGDLLPSFNGNLPYGTGSLKASVTTATMFGQPDVIENWHIAVEEDVNPSKIDETQDFQKMDTKPDETS